MFKWSVCLLVEENRPQVDLIYLFICFVVIKKSLHLEKTKTKEKNWIETKETGSCDSNTNINRDYIRRCYESIQ